jgi:kynurenine 3-monooxygenase
MEKQTQGKITIIGSGLAGSFLAVLLAKRGYQVDIYERLDKKDICDISSKRSYNIVLFGYGITLLKEAGLWDDIKPYLLTLKGTVTHITKKIKPVLDIVDHEKMPYFTITRARLADILLKKATLNSLVTIHYNMALLSVDRYNKSILIQNVQTKKISKVPCVVIIGADGANSLVRSFLQQGQHSTHTQEYASWIYRQFILSPETVEKLKLEKKFVHIWTQKNAFITMHPDSNDALGAMLVFPKNDVFSSMLYSKEETKVFFEKNFPELLPAMNEIYPSLLENPDGNFATIHTDPWYYKDFIAIIGDAAHGFYPFFGQGTSAAFGDCIQFIKLLDTYGPDWGKIFPLYQEARKKHTDILGDLSKEVIKKYLRYKKGDFEAIYDKFESEAHRFFPKLIQPPLSQSVITDPAHAADHRENYLKQKRIVKKAGISLLVASLAGLITLYEFAERKKK